MPKYRNGSTRLSHWDYRNEGAYFLTICTDNRIHHFGECKNGKMQLSTAGAIVQGCWYQIPKLNNHVRLGEFVVMPNHIHGVLIIERPPPTVGALKFNAPTVGGINNDTTTPKNKHFQDLSPKSGSVSRMIQQYKRACTLHIKNVQPDIHFRWQPRFHDHIIRDQASYERISQYIIDNPKKWQDDKFYQHE